MWHLLSNLKRAAFARVALAVLCGAGSMTTASAQKPTPAPPPPAEFMRQCSYALWYPWYVQNQSRKPTEPEPRRPEPDGVRDPVGDKCLQRLRLDLEMAGLAPPNATQIIELRAAAKAGKAAALFEAFEALKAGRRAQ